MMAHAQRCGQSEKPSVLCTRCGSQFARKYDLTRHMKSCQGKKKREDTSKVCSHCGRGFANAFSRRRHEEGCDGGQKNEATSSTICSLCSKSFSRPDARKRHEDKCKGPKENEEICEENHSHHLINRTFSSLAEAKSWVTELEFDQEFRIRDSSDNMEKWICRRNRHYKAKRKDGTCGNVDCAAKLRVTGDESSGSVVGCVSHSHKPKPRFNKISLLKKLELESLLALQIPVEVILEQNMDIEENRLPILRRDLNRIKAKLADKKSEFESIKDILMWEETRCFNFDKAGWKKEVFHEQIQQKHRDSDEMFVCRISEYGRKNFRVNSGTIICDASHNTNKNNW